jgi:PIN domain nuclease of toxin-antitoxin system
VSDAVLDASALLAYIRREPGAAVVERAIRIGSSISTVSVAEVVSKLSELGVTDEDIRQILASMALEIVPFDRTQAFLAGFLRLRTRHLGLSLGDRACLALAEYLDVPALTADRIWQSLSVGIEIRLIR